MLPTIPAPHAETAERLLAELGADAGVGLSAEEAAERLRQHGPNRLPEPPAESRIIRFLRQFLSPIVLTLLAAAVIALLVEARGTAGAPLWSRFGDASAILLIVVLNAILGYVQERKAETALAALRRMAVPNARVLRGGDIHVVPAAELVPGDVLALEAGDAVPADARLLDTADLVVEEATLTGESMPVAKDARAPVTADAPLGDRANMVYLGTTCVRGKGHALVVATGRHTELGRIGEALSAAGSGPTPLEYKLGVFGRQVLWACLVVSVALFAWGMWRGDRPWHALLLEAVSFAVALIPEGLPAITTITLALGMQRMADKGVIVRRLPAVETLGSATVICTDKTGTLTQNEMTVRAMFAAGLRFQVSGEGYAPRGTIIVEGGAEDGSDDPPAAMNDMLITAALCNNARLTNDTEGGGWSLIGDPTEGALLTLACKGGVVPEETRRAHEVIRELPFDSDRKRMTVIARGPDGRQVAHIKGGVDVLLPLCTHWSSADEAQPLTPAGRASIQAEADRMSSAALRVLALARRDDPIDSAPEEGLTLLGLVGMMDPPREGVREAIATCREAGVAVVMITGDHQLTAMAIARELDLWRPGDQALSGAELQRLSDDELQKRARHVRVFARTTAEQKLRIIQAMKADGQVVAMTGDGVNDAPALREAHIGVAMGRCGTDVARQAADIVITDDNFATIVHGVREGRAIFRNIQKFIFYLLSSNAALALAVFAASFYGGWLPLTPLMILVINFVTNGLPALALGADPPDPEQMKEPPRPPGSRVLGKRDYVGIAYVGLVMGALAVLLYMWPDPGPERARVMAFALLGFSPLFHVWNCRSPTASLFTLRPLLRLPILGACVLSAGIELLAVAVPALWPVFHTGPLSLTHWLIIVGLSALVIPAVELAKAAMRALH